jgi:predicted dehydrogenase
MRYTVHFERATVDYDLARQETLMLYQDEKATAVEHSHKNGYLGEIGYFLECVAARQRPRQVTAADAVMGLRIAEAEKRSVETGRVVEL